jgi:hypothetical protein
MGEWMYRSKFSWPRIGEGEWSASRPCRFTSGEITSGTHWIEGSVDPRAGLDGVEKRKFWTLAGLELRSLGRPVRSQLLYRLRYPGSYGEGKCEELDEAAYTDRRSWNAWETLPVMTGAVRLSLYLVQCKLRPRTIKMASYIVVGQSWPYCWQENKFSHLTTTSWKIPGRRILFNGARRSLPRIIAARAKCWPRTSM